MADTLYELIFKGPQKAEHIAIEGIGCEPLTYGMLRQQIVRTVALLNGMGYRKNDRLVLVLPDGPVQAVATLAVRTGFTSISLPPSSSREELETYLTGLDAKAIIVEQESEAITAAATSLGLEVILLVPEPGREAGVFGLRGRRAAQPADPVFAGRDDMSDIRFTSGTTSRPKAVPMAQWKNSLRVEFEMKQQDYREDDRSLLLLPVSSGIVLYTSFLAPLAAGARVICLPGFDEARIVEWMRAYQPTIIVAVPTILAMILRQMKKQGNPLKEKPRHIISGGAATEAALGAELEHVFGIPVVAGYGANEAGWITVYDMAETGKPGSAGKSRGPEIAAVDGEGRFLPRGEAGEIVVRGPMVFDGYLNDPEATKEAFVDGWYRTGDLGHIDADGYLFLSGRIKEMISYGGKKVSPFEVEQVLKSHPYVAEAVVFKVPGGELGETVGAAIKLKEGYRADENDFRVYASERLSFYKVPSRIFFVREIPVDPKTGKYPRNRMAGLIETAAGAEPAAPGPADPSDGTEAMLAGIWEQVLGTGPVGPGDDFFRLGGDSVKAAAILGAVSGKYGVRLSLNTIFRCPTVAKMTQAIREQGAGRADDQLFVLRPGGPQVPLFCMHGANGNLMKYQDLAESLGRCRPVYGIQAADISGAAGDAESIESMAAAYVKVIKSVQREGPYCLCGHSFSATLAFEAARQLE